MGICCPKSRPKQTQTQKSSKKKKQKILDTEQSPIHKQNDDKNILTKPKIIPISKHQKKRSLISENTPKSTNENKSEIVKGKGPPKPQIKQPISELRKMMSITVNKASKKPKPIQIMEGINEVPVSVQSRIKKEISLRSDKSSVRKCKDTGYQVITTTKGDDIISTSGAFSKEVFILRNSSKPRTPPPPFTKKSNSGNIRKYLTNEIILTPENGKMAENPRLKRLKAREKKEKKRNNTLVGITEKVANESDSSQKEIMDFTKEVHQRVLDLELKEPSFETIEIECTDDEEINSIVVDELPLVFKKKKMKTTLPSQFQKHNYDKTYNRIESLNLQKKIQRHSSSSLSSVISDDWNKSAIAEKFEKSRIEEDKSQKAMEILQKSKSNLMMHPGVFNKNIKSEKKFDSNRKRFSLGIRDVSSKKEFLEKLNRNLEYSGQYE